MRSACLALALAASAGLTACAPARVAPRIAEPAYQAGIVPVAEVRHARARCHKASAASTTRKACRRVRPSAQTASHQVASPPKIVARPVVVGY